MSFAFGVRVVQHVAFQTQPLDAGEALGVDRGDATDTADLCKEGGREKVKTAQVVAQSPKSAEQTVAHLWVWVWVWLGSGVLLQTRSWVWVEGEEEGGGGEEGPGPPAAPPQTGRPPGRRPVCPEDNSHTLT